MTDFTALPNSPESLAPLIADGRLPKQRVWGMLLLRSALSFALLIVVAVGLAIGRQENPVGKSAAWWLWFVTAVNIVCIYLLARFSKLEGMRLRDIYNLNGKTWKGDLLWAIGALIVIAAVAQPPGTLLANAFWGGTTYPNSLLFQPIPFLAIYPLFIIFPLSHVLAELPTYWGYVAPRFRAGKMNRWIMILIVGFFLSIQHMFFSFQLDLSYDLWLAIKFLPFALCIGFIIDRRPTTLPYLMVGHGLLDLTLPYFVLLISQGLSIF